MDAITAVLTSKEFLFATNAAQNAMIDAVPKADRAKYSTAYRKFHAWLDDAGDQLRDCFLENFELTQKGQREARDTLRDCSADPPDKNVLLIGPCGAGKDHLAVGLVRRFSKRLIRCGYVSGPILFTEMAEAWKFADVTESSVLANYIAPQVLIISDPSLSDGLSEAARRFFYKLIDGRGRGGKATIITLNAPSGSAAESLLGPAVWSRLRNNSINIPCLWADYRVREKAAQSETDIEKQSIADQERVGALISATATHGGRGDEGEIKRREYIERLERDHGAVLDAMNDEGFWGTCGVDTPGLFHKRAYPAFRITALESLEKKRKVDK